MPRIIPPAKIKEWLDRHDAGEALSAIARSDRKDLRTVQNHVEKALRQRDLQMAQRNLLQEALREHQADLAKTLQRLKRSVHAPPTEVGFIGRMDEVPVRMPASWEYDPARGSLTLAGEGKMPFRLLRDHLRGERKWAALEQWRRAVAGYLPLCLEHWREICGLSESETGLPLRNTFDRKGHLTYAFPGLLLQSVLERVAKGNVRGFSDEDFRSDPDGTVRITHGAELTVSRTKDGQEECVAAFLRVQEKLTDSERVRELGSSYKRAVARAAVFREYLDELLLTHLVPGRCSVCRRLGM